MSDPLPIYPWRISSRYSLPTLDVKGVMAALNSAVTAEGVYWGVNYYDSTTVRQIELKRIGSPPAGEMTTFRGLLFGQPSAGSPAAAALDGDTITAGTLYQCICVDANTSASGPPNSYKTTDPYSGINGTTRGWTAQSGTVVASSSLYFAESELGFFWSWSDGNPASATQGYFGGFGYLWDENGTLGWVSITPRSLITTAYPTNVTPSGFHIPGLQTIAAANVPRMVGVRTGSANRWELGRIQDVPFALNARDGSALYRSDGGVLLPVALCGRLRGGGLDGSFMGRLRQIKYGKSMIDRDTTLDTIFMGGSTSSVGAGIHLDNIA